MNIDKAKPILFSTPMVQAILAGCKTQTRRVIEILDDYNFIETEQNPVCVDERRKSGERVMKGLYAIFENSENDLRAVKSRYEPGDILWVRETWADILDTAPGNLHYKASATEADLTWFEKNGWKWRPSIHMPREAARIFLRVTDVKVERLQFISLIDAINDGCAGVLKPDYSDWIIRPEQEFEERWDKNYVRHGFGLGTRPWVWVYTFERCDPNNKGAA